MRCQYCNKSALIGKPHCNNIKCRDHSVASFLLATQTLPSKYLSSLLKSITVYTHESLNTLFFKELCYTIDFVFGIVMIYTQHSSCTITCDRHIKQAAELLHISDIKSCILSPYIIDFIAKYQNNTMITDYRGMHNDTTRALFRSLVEEVFIKI